MPDLLLAADIGGSNTRLRLVDAAEPAAPLDEHVYGDGKPVESAVRAYIERIGEQRGALRAACFGVAGRVVDGDVSMTNRPGETLTDELLASALGLPKQRVSVVNDMVAHLSGVELSETLTLRPGREIGGVEGIVMPGTGLGVGYAVRDAATDRRVAMPSEGGHLDFGPPAPALDALLPWARRRLADSGDAAARVSWEWFTSGPGLARIYRALASEEGREEKGVRPEAVTAAALGKESELDASLARRATAVLLELAGARAGNLCLDILATRAIWFGGNILNMLHDHDPARFTAAVSAAFDACGPDALRDTLVNVPLHLIRSPDSGLRGAAALARERM